MAALNSPDLPAYVCYALVLGIGILVARAAVNGRLAEHPDHWAFASSFSLVVAYALIPLPLFWLLDHLSIIQDTSLFAALLVALGYRQIITGKMQGITVPSQVSMLWSPLEQWEVRVAARIGTKQGYYSSRFEEEVRTSLLANADLLKQFEDFIIGRSRDAAQLQLSLQALPGNLPPSGAALKRVRILWGDLRASESNDWGYLLYRAKFISRFDHWWYLSNGRAKTVGMLVLLLALAGGSFGAFVWVKSDWRPNVERRYHQWRWSKPNASEMDRFRTQTYLAHTIATEQMDRSVGEGVRRTRILELLGPLLHDLRFRQLPVSRADDLRRLLVDAHSPAVDGAVVPLLIEALRTENADVRLRVKQTLVDLHNAGYSEKPLDSTLENWEPKSDESAADLDRKVRSWQQWWRNVGPTTTGAGAANTGSPAPTPARS